MSAHYVYDDTMICDMTKSINRFMLPCTWLIGEKDQEDGHYLSFISYLRKLIDTTTKYDKVRKLVLTISEESCKDYELSDHYIIANKDESVSELSVIKHVFPNLVKLTITSTLLYKSTSNKYRNEKHISEFYKKELKKLDVISKNMNIELKIK